MKQIKAEAWAVFEDDAQRVLHGIENCLLALESNPNDQEQLNELFRELHTLKGSSGFLDLVAVARLTHTAEDLVDHLREAQMRMDPSIASLLLETADLLRTIIEQSADGPKEEHNRLIEPLCARLTACLREATARTQATTEAKKLTPAQAVEMSEAVAVDLLAALDEAEGRVLVLSTELYTSLQGLRAASNCLGTGAYAQLLDYLWGALREGRVPVIRLLWHLAHRELESTATAGTVLFDEAPAAGRDDPEAVQLFLAAFAAVLKPAFASIQELVTHPAGGARLRSTLSDASRMASAMGYIELDGILSDMERGSAGTDASALMDQLADLVELVVELQVAWQDDTNAHIDPEHDVRRIFRSLRSVTESATAPPPPADGRPSRARPDPSRPPPSPGRPSRFLRVEVDKVAGLMSLTGEIGLAIGDVLNLPALRDVDNEDVRISIDRVESLIRELQDTSASLGLIPLSTVFGRMTRIARDVSQQLDKPLTLNIDGGDTEIDKVLVDALNDPLIHLIRNAADHGIENRQARAAAGKTPIAQIRLAARREGNHVLITIKDDGRGMDRESILNRAIDRGLVHADAAPSLRDSQVWPLVFEPGFSTAKQVTGISGRGIGMDVVKSSVQGLGGRVSITSTPGVGTIVRLRLPLTLAFLDGMVVRVGTSMYVLPVTSVSRVFRVLADDIVHVASEDVDLVRMGERLVPCLSLEEFFGLGTRPSLVNRLVVVVRTTSGELALPIDELVGNEQVTMKPLTGHLARIRAGAGCGLLRNGGVAIALNCESLVELKDAEAA